MDYSNVPVHFSKSAADKKQEAIHFKVDYCWKHMFELDKKHHDFIRTVNNWIFDKKELTEPQVKYLESLFNQLMD